VLAGAGQRRGRGVGRRRRRKKKWVALPIRKKADRGGVRSGRNPRQGQTTERVRKGDSKKNPKAPPPPRRSTTRGASKRMPAPCSRRKDNVRRPGRRREDKGEGPEEPPGKVGQSKRNRGASPGVKSVGHSKIQESAGEGEPDGEREA
jgi:hypothetical protein